MSMLKTERDNDRLYVELESRIDEVDAVIEEVRRFLDARGVADDSAIILVLRELVNNGIEHGNAKDADKTVAVEVAAVEDERYRIMVRDEGAGFDHQALDLTLPDDPTRVRNRGLALVNNFADQLDFESGTVTAWLTIKPETYFATSQEEDWTVIRPSGDLTARVADEFRTTLLDLLEAGHSRFRFQLENVGDIDSITLSIFVIFSNTLLNKDAEAGLEIAGANKDIVSMFQLTRLDRSYRIAE